MSEKRILRMHLKKKWWEQIRDGKKWVEYRIASEFWRRRLEGREFDEVHLTMGYPSSSDKSRTLIRRFEGIERQTLKHDEFGPVEVSVFAILFSEM